MREIGYPGTTATEQTSHIQWKLSRKLQSRTLDNKKTLEFLFWRPICKCTDSKSDQTMMASDEHAKHT